MQQPTTPTPSNELAPLFPGQHADDGSSHAHRQLIGVLGALLPPLVWLIAGCRSSDDTTPWDLLPSISDYYYTGAVAAFTGLLAALALVLLTYGGYRNKDGRQDRIAGRIAGLAALAVAFFPTTPHADIAKPAWWEPTAGTIHIAAAVVLFLAFAYFALVLFRKGDASNDPGKRMRNRIYILCGSTILLAMGWTAWSHFAKRPIFWPEAIMLWAFATSWLVKGRADMTAVAALRNLVTQPGKSAKAMANAVTGKGE